MEEQPTEEQLEMTQQLPKNQPKMTQEHMEMCKKWIEIENIVILPFDHELILPDSKDSCPAIHTDACNYNDKCKIHVKSDYSEICVGKKRISNFRKKG